MGWVSNLLNNREIQRLEELTGKAPAPSVFLRLGELYAAQGEPQKAREILLQGQKMFPDDSRLQAARTERMRAAHEHEIALLRKKIEQFPNPTLYAKLATIYLEEDDYGACGKTCRDAVKKFPNYGGAHLILAQMAERQGEETECVSQLEEAVALDPHNYRALLLLAEKYAEQNRRDEATGTVKKILVFAPEDERASALLAHLQKTEDRPPESSEADSSTAATTEMTAVQGDPPTARVSYSAPKRASSSSEIYSAESIKRAVGHLTRVEGVEGCVLMDRNGFAVAGSLGDDQDEELIAALATDIFRTAHESSRALQLGEFLDGSIESENGNIYTMSLQKLILSVFADSSARAGLIQRAMHTFAEQLGLRTG